MYDDCSAAGCLSVIATSVSILARFSSISVHLVSAEFRMMAVLLCIWSLTHGYPDLFGFEVGGRDCSLSFSKDLLIGSVSMLCSGQAVG